MLATEPISRPFEVRLSLPHPSNCSNEMIATNNRDALYMHWLALLHAQLFKVHPSLNQPRCRLVLLSTRLENKHAAVGNTPVEGSLWVASLGRVQWTLQAEMHQGEKLIATATQTGYHINPVTQDPVWVSETLLQTYWDYQWSL